MIKKEKKQQKGERTRRKAIPDMDAVLWADARHGTYRDIAYQVRGNARPYKLPCDIQRECESKTEKTAT